MGSLKGICPVCGLPEDLCVCEQTKEEVVIKVKLEHRKFNKPTTVIEGLNPKSDNLEEIAKKLKSWLACGGTVKDGRILLQGDHRASIPKYLVKLGFKEENIQIL